MMNNNLRCSAAVEKLQYLKNRLRWLISSAEFADIQASSAEVLQWEGWVTQIESLMNVCEGILPHMKVPFTSNQLKMIEDIDGKVCSLIDKYEN